MRLIPAILILMVFLLGSCCSRVPFVPTELVPAVPRSAASLIGGLWNSGNGSYLIRQSALFELQGLQAPIEGVMKLDLDQKRARLVGLNDMGVKLYDLSIDRNSSEAHFIIPDLAKYPGFAEAVAVSVRRIFLDPSPALDDVLTLTRNSYLLTRSNSGGTLRFVIGGQELQLLEKTFAGPDEAWRVNYYQYRKDQGLKIPGGIILEDDTAGYRLTLWIESVEKTDE